MRTSQTPAQRRLSKVAAALNQAWMRTARKKGDLYLASSGRKLTADDLAMVWLDAGGRCRYCDIEVEIMTVSFDHVIPLSKGGLNERENLAACCMTCQRTKHTKTPEEHLEYRATWRTCPVDGTRFRPRFADIARGYGVYCSRRCSGSAASR